MQLITLIAGLVLVLNSGWFHGASLIGWILLGITGLITLVQLVFLGGFAWLVRKGF
jgi:hypothetical protein